jgi:hypothetical protein
MAATVGAQWNSVLLRGAVIVLITEQVGISVTVYNDQGDDGSSKQGRIHTRTLRVIIPLMFGAMSCSE